MKILVTGVNGQLGHDVIAHLDARGVACKGVDIQDFDLTDEQQVMDAVKAYAPTAIVHCAAYTAVDRAEEEKEKAYAVNVLGTRHMAQAAQAVDASLMYISTDYVFDGKGETPFEVDAPKGPQSVYGRTKLQGEEEVQKLLQKYFIVRTSWVFGLNGHNFIKTMLRLGKEGKHPSVVDDQIGSPTYTWDLARLLCDMIVTDKYGVYHATNENLCSWYEFACAIFQTAGMTDIQVTPVSTAQYGAKAARPMNSRLSKASLDRAGFDRLPTWQDALARYIHDLPQA